MKPTATHINYYHVCHRKLWLFSNGIQMEHTSETVEEGKLIGEESYPQRPAKYTELEFEGVKIDFYDPVNKVVHEIKKSDAVEKAHIAQVKYYLYLLKKKGIEATGIIEYPKLKQTEKVSLENLDIPDIERWITEIEKIVASASCPELLHAKICRNCSYFDFCYISEDELSPL